MTDQNNDGTKVQFAEPMGFSGLLREVPVRRLTEAEGTQRQHQHIISTRVMSEESCITGVPTLSQLPHLLYTLDLQ